ncbi:unnamed protein product [Rotaria sp. Silwood1]|nr:unnamed protein product [Rotaria sp. Silwood1]CAF1571947.1 unnamed protein product [Rotaria sp. Silwood1]CAF1576238.1 unnamed protein product [Rotaria sp. Silwood1]CAF3454985.1 unnamed protein product [Rotaria sp. Silwood1]CAF3773355.1 unnamed protein product [Rotaria sp. Silwood1]
MKIACVTYENDIYASSIENEDIILVQYLQEKDIDIKIEIWTDPDVNWKTYDLIILKSTWDYHYKIDQFYTWLTMLRCQNIRILNPYDIIKWNSDKHYLQHIADAGLNIIPTFWLKKNEKLDLIKYFKVLSTEKLVIKPSISASAVNTFVYNQDDIIQAIPKIDRLLQEQDFIIQPFMKEIQTMGEWSFIFFNGEFSHSVLKIPKSGDFRVQRSFGGIAHFKSAPNHLIQYVKEYVEIFAKDCLFARIDGLDIGGQFFLMELELIEPYLFLSKDKNSFERFYKARKHILHIN